MKRIQNSIVMSQQEWLNVAVLAKWIPDTFLKTAQTAVGEQKPNSPAAVCPWCGSRDVVKNSDTYTSCNSCGRGFETLRTIQRPPPVLASTKTAQTCVLQCPKCKQQFPLGPTSAMCPKCKVATVVTQPTDVVSGNLPPPPATSTMPSIANTATGLQKTARIDNVRFANNTVSLTPEEWEQIGMRTGWLEKEAGLMDWWKNRQQQKKQKQQQEAQRQNIRQQVNQNVDTIVGDVEKAQGLVGRNGTIYRDSVAAFDNLKRLMKDVQWLAGMDPQGEVIPKEQIQGVEQAIQLAGKQVTDIATLISSLTAEPNLPEANLRGAPAPAATPAKPKRQRKAPTVAPAPDESGGRWTNLPVTAKTSVRLVKTA